MGQGAHTVFQQIAAEALDTRPGAGRGARRTHRADRFERQHVGQPHELYGGQRHQGGGGAGAGRVAERGAARHAPSSSFTRGRPPPTTGRRARPTPTSPMATAHRSPRSRWTWRPAMSPSSGWSAPTTWARPSTRMQIEGQIEGAVAQSVGWTLMEHYVQKDGRAVTQHLSTYLIPSVLDVAEVVEPVILEIPDPQGPFGAARDGRDAVYPHGAGHCAPPSTPPPASGSTNCRTRPNASGKRCRAEHEQCYEPGRQTFSLGHAGHRRHRPQVCHWPAGAARPRPGGSRLAHPGAFGPIWRRVRRAAPLCFL